MSSYFSHFLQILSSKDNLVTTISFRNLWKRNSGRYLICEDAIGKAIIENTLGTHIRNGIWERHSGM